MHLFEQVEGDIVLHQDIATVIGQLGVLQLQPLEAEGAALLGNRATHCRRAKLEDLRREKRGPTRLAIARLLNQNHSRAKIQHWSNLGKFRAIGEREELDIELASDFTEKMIDPH